MTTTNTITQRKPLSQEVKEFKSAENDVNTHTHKEIPNESESDDEKDVTQDIDDDDTAWIAKDEVKLNKKQNHDGHIHAEDIDRSKLSPSERAEMEKVDKLIAKFEVPQDDVAWRLVTPAVISFFALILISPFILTRSFLISLPWLFIVGGFRVRLFIIFHDCGHGCFFSKFKDNMRIGNFLELCVATPFKLWLKRHNRHHRVQGNSDKLDLSSTIPITVTEYYSLPTLKRIIFRIVREPIVFFVIAPLLIWDIFYLCLNGTKRILASRTAIAIYFCAGLYWNGYSYMQSLIYGFVWEQAFTYVPGLIGLLLFHLQHSANNGYRAPDALFDAKQTAMKGSTYVTVPWYLRWITLNIEFHHIHHWSTRVPSYRLEECHNAGEAVGMWEGITRINTFPLFLDALPNALWCDKRQRYVTFREL